MSKNNVNRRQFIGAVGAASAAGLAFPSCSKSESPADKKEEHVFLDTAPDGELLKAGLVGCGGRGTGAALNFLSAGKNLKVTALADVLKDRLDGCRNKLKSKFQNEVPEENCYIGFDAYQKLIDSGVDIVILATPPHFRPEHFAAAIKNRKHVFMEKPVAVDPVGARSIIASSKKAEAAGLSVTTGTQRRHQRDYNATYKKIMNGAIGDIISANCYWNQSQLWYKNRQEGQSDMEYMIRDWVNWCWLSGDHIVEQHVHNIDVINWFTGMHPVSAVGFGARHRRITGDQYDFFSVDFTYENGMHVHSMCRQIDGCENNVSEFIAGSKGSTNCCNTIYDRDGKEIWKYDYTKDEELKKMKKAEQNIGFSAYYQEHIDLVTAIRTDKPFVEAENTAISTLAAIMGRISAYTGKKLTFDEMMKSGLRLGPKTYEMGPVAIKAKCSIPGRDKPDSGKK